MECEKQGNGEWKLRGQPNKTTTEPKDASDNCHIPADQKEQERWQQR